MSSNLYLVLELQLAHFLRNEFLKYLMVSHYIYIYIYIYINNWIWNFWFLYPIIHLSQKLKN